MRRLHKRFSIFARRLVIEQLIARADAEQREKLEGISLHSRWRLPQSTTIYLRRDMPLRGHSGLATSFSDQLAGAAVAFVSMASTTVDTHTSATAERHLAQAPNRLGGAP